jgi:adenylosuccinate lyase
VGTFAHLPPGIERYVCWRLRLKPAPSSTQIVQRDRHAHFFTTLAGIASSIEKLAVEIRHLQRTEVSEVAEPFGKRQKGSSAMPHKRNPILCENLTGLARLVRSNAIAALENVATWHERDISHSSVERVIAPDSTILVDFMLSRMTGVIEGLEVHPERMAANLDATRGLYCSQDVMLALVKKGMKREDAYKLVQKHALYAWDKGEYFKVLLESDPKVTKHLSKSELESCFDLEQHFRHVDSIFKRVFKG